MRDSVLKNIWNVLKPYLLTVASVTCIGLIKFWLNKTFLLDSTLLLFFTSIALATWYGGFRQGLLALILAIFVAHVFLTPTTESTSTITALVGRYLMFGVDCLLVATVFAAFRRSRERFLQSEEIRRSQYFLDSVVENIPNMIFVKDAKDLKFVGFNRAGEELVGQSRNDLIGKSDFDFFPKEQAEGFREKDYEVLRGNKVVWIPEETIQTSTGIRFLSTKKIPIRGPDGQPQYLLGISEDITDRKEIEKQRLSLMVEQAARIEAEKTARRFSFLSRASAALTESLNTEVMLRSFANAIVGEMADMCVISTIVEGNEKAEATIACSREDLSQIAPEWMQNAPLNWNLDFGAPKIVREGKSKLYSHLNDEDIRELVQNENQFAIAKKFGLVSMILVPVQLYGKVLGSVIIASADQARRYDELDLSVAEDLARRAFYAIENARLYQNAQEANRAKSSFLANISHEIRTPLGAMLGFTEILMDGEQKLTDRQQHFLQTIQRNGKQLLKIVDEVLDISKVESERLYFEQVPFSLTNLMDDVTTLLRRLATQKNLVFNINTSGLKLGRIVSDPNRLRQILINVIGNAIKFTEKGSISVEVALREVPNLSPAKLMLEIVVRDTGIGISPAQAAQLFQPFTQADSSMARRFGGTGLGLFLSRKMARLLGGDLVLRRSEPHSGSEFVLTILVEPQKAAQLEGDATRESLIESDKTNLSGKVLVVDDSIDNREWMQYACEHLGLKIDTAESGEEGVKKALRNGYDAILMDIQMPEMDGFAAVRALQLSQYKGPVIAVTAHAMKGDRENCLNKGFDDYLCKPLSRQSLEDCLRKHIKLSS